MKLHALDAAIILIYFVFAIAAGIYVARRGSKDLNSYFLGGKTLPWYYLGVSNASGMFDISGTMWLVYVLFIYGLKSIWLPWVWPTFNQIFLMVFVSAWLRRSNVLTGAEWIQTRFGRGKGANLAHLSVVLFALVNVVGMLAYGFKGIGKFADVMLPWHFTSATEGLFTNANIYAIIILSLTSIYAIKGGMVSVVITEVMQFTILTLTSIIIGIVAICKVSPDMIKNAVPEGWTSPFFGKHLGLDWSAILPTANDAIKQDGNELFGIIFGLMFFKGVMASLAGPAPNYDMQRILATRNTREASLMSGMVNVVLMFPRYFMIAGLTVMALVFFMPQLHGMAKPDFEELLPNVLQYVPTGVVGLLLAGLLAAFMSNFAATLNAAPAYIVNDIYKRFMNPNSSAQTQVRLSRLWSIIVLAVGILFGLLTTRITDVMMWIVGALYGGYVMANVLKWIWWRFNGYGYFYGMLAGILSAMIVPPAYQQIAGHAVSNQLYLFPIILVISIVGCVLGTLLSKPEDNNTLMAFYKNVRPWGFWGPIRDQVTKDDPSFKPNGDFCRDCFNVAVGIVWQLSMVTMPIYIVLRQWNWVALIVGVFLVTSAILKFTWYNKLEKA
jgi:solute:Na+ symporter, SSS family